jgi:serine protease Do
MNTLLHSLVNRRRATFAAAVLAVAGVIAGVHAAQSTANPAIALKRDAQPVTRGQLERASFSDVVKRVSPSVVKITTQTKAKQVALNGGEMPGMNDPLLRQFFGGNAQMFRQEPAQSGLGSGVIISSDGYIVTNNHVVNGADTVTVSLEDGRDLTAKVVGRDPQTDVAVIKVEARDLPAITFADSTKVDVGDRVLAVGNPFGIGETVTTGIVSAKGRRVGILSDVQGYEDFLQTDAAINPGNSGGALVDVDGRLIGLNTAILSRSGGFQGVGLAVPANLVSQVADSLVKHGKVTRGFLGVSAQDITPALADSFNLKDHNGALIAEVVPGSPAAKAGLKEGDVIKAVNGQPVADANRLTFAVSAVAPHQNIKLEVLRDGKTEHLTATTGERPSNGPRSLESAVASDDDQGVLNGVSVEDVNRDVRNELKLPGRVKGAVITQVAPESAAARAGLREGDVILEINRHPVTTADEAVKLTSKTETKKTLLKLWSHGNTIYVVVDESGADKDAS